MNISGIRPSVGFYNENSIMFRPEFSSLALDEAQEESLADSSISSLSEEDIKAVREKQTFGSYDFASQYKPDVTYDLKGVDSDIKSLDVEKAVSDMQKDSAIHRYQYFVQNKPSSTVTDSTVSGTENFSL